MIYPNSIFYYSPTPSRRHLAPAVRMIVQSSRNSALEQDIEAILDTGSAATCVPETVITSLGGDLLPYDYVKIMGVTGKPERRKRYRINITIGNCAFVPWPVVAIPRSYALIGRDIANSHVIELDGKNQRWSMSPC